MLKGRFAWVLPLLRYGLCAVAILYLVSVVRWYDRARLTETGDHWYRVLERGADHYVIDRHGVRETVALDRVHHVEVGGRHVPEIELGIRSVVLGLNVGQAIWALALFIPVTLIQSGRLIVMLAIQGVRLGYWTCTKLTFAGNFFNFALPGTTGGDIFKAYYIAKYAQKKTEVVTTVFLDRAIGLLGLVFLAGGAIAFTRRPEQFSHLVASLLIICGVLAAGALVLFSRRMREFLHLRAIAQRLPLGEQIIRVGRATVAMRDRKLLVLLAMLMTMVLQGLCMVSAAVMAWAIGMRGELTDFFIYCSIGFLIAAIPISPPQAIGVMEAAYVQFFTAPPLGNDASQAVALALAVRLIQLFWALPGLLVPLLGAHVPSEAELEALQPEVADASAAVASPQPAGAPAVRGGEAAAAAPGAH